TPVLTARYSHRRLYDLAGAVEKLPRFLPTEDRAETAGLAATGTDGVGFGCTLVAHTPALSGHPVASAGSEREGEKPSLEMTQPPVSQGFSHRQTSSVISGHQRGRRDSNPQPPDRQFSTCRRRHNCLKHFNSRPYVTCPSDSGASALSTLYAVFRWF